MKAIAWLIRLVFFLLVLWFALKNTTPVPVRLTEKVVWNDVPLIVVMLVCLVIGALAGAAALAPRLFRGRRRPSKRERDLLAESATTIQPGENIGQPRRPCNQKQPLQTTLSRLRRGVCTAVHPAVPALALPRRGTLGNLPRLAAASLMNARQPKATNATKPP